MISEAIGAVCKRIIDAIVRGLARSRINPNVLTFIGCLSTSPAECYTATPVLHGGLFMILANLLTCWMARSPVFEGELPGWRVL